MLWSKYFPDVRLTDPRWIERCNLKFFEDALRITVAKDRAARFPVRDQENIGRYVCRVIRRLENGWAGDTNGETLTFRMTIRAGYKLSEADKTRFNAHLRARWRLSSVDWYKDQSRLRKVQGQWPGDPSAPGGWPSECGNEHEDLGSCCLTAARTDSQSQQANSIRCTTGSTHRRSQVSRSLKSG